MSATNKREDDSFTRLVRYVAGERYPVFVILLFFAIASGVLFFRIDRGLDPNYGKNWWVLSFETRDPDSSRFTVENHSSATRFTYTFTHDKDILDTGDLTIPKGRHKTVTPTVPSLPGRTVITVTADDGTKKEIYRER
ncbi:MAG: hypothetical protein HGA31_01765 [Candidatus Moranbacteria bacterium]|nr:hypothetical protein [Candidatus Moranbacteria bacterium]